MLFFLLRLNWNLVDSPLAEINKGSLFCSGGNINQQSSEIFS